ncbi:MAG TPA: GerMN domain-containing protein [Micromonosporaceae bacterium]|nr:GerMN domain-containing protein [Micromonosporaceae bacterium]
MTGPKDIEAVLRRAFDEAAGRVDVAPDALGTIRTRIEARRGRLWRRTRSGRPARPRHFRGGLMLGMGSAVAASVVVLAVGIGSCNNPSTNPTPVGGPPATATQPSPTNPGSSTTTATPPGTANVPVYYLGATKAGTRLFREYHVLPDGDGSTAAQVKAAITAMLDGRTAYDPDYSSQWPASASVRGVTVSGGVTTVDLGGATVNGYDPEGNRAALQQLIWTATAYKGATGVKLLFDGKSQTTLWASKLPVAGVLHRAAAADALAPVWVIDPQQGAQVGSPVTVNLAGVVFEGTVQLRVTRASGGAPVVQRSVQLSVGAPAQGTARVTLTLAPGTYEIEVMELSLKDGSVVATDNHTFTVK